MTITQEQITALVKRLREAIEEAQEKAADLGFLVPLIEKQSCGEWCDSLIASDARIFRNAILSLKPKGKTNE